MTKTKKILFTVIAWVVYIGSLFGIGIYEDHHKVIIVPPAPVQTSQQAFFQVAKVFGRGGCGDYALAEKVVHWSNKNDVPPALEAAIVTVESTCKPLAISNKGAVGLGQIQVSVWSRENDFSKINLFNPDENLDLSTKIVHNLIHQYGGNRAAVLHYNNMDQGYADKVLTLANLDKEKE